MVGVLSFYRQTFLAQTRNEPPSKETTPKKSTNLDQLQIFGPRGRGGEVGVGVRDTFPCAPSIDVLFLCAYQVVGRVQ